jgi:hypothetical protein
VSEGKQGQIFSCHVYVYKNIFCHDPFVFHNPPLNKMDELAEAVIGLKHCNASSYMLQE